VKNSFVSNLIGSLFQKPLVKIEPQSVRTQTADMKTYLESDPIEKLILKPIIESILKSKKINTVGKLYRYKRKRLKKIKHLGPKSVNYLMKIKRTIRLIKDESFEYQTPQKSVEIISNNKSDDKNGFGSVFGPIDIPNDISINDSIDSLNLPKRLENALKDHANIFTVDELINFPENKLIKTRNIGGKAIDYLLKIKKTLGIEPKKEEKTFTEDQGSERKNDEIQSYVYKETYLSGKEDLSLLSLPTRVENALGNGGIETIEQFYQCSPKDLLGLRNLGYKSVNHLLKIRDQFKTISKGATQNGENKLSEDVFEAIGFSATDPIETLRLPLHIENTLKKRNIKNLSELYLASRDQITSLQNVGFISMDRVMDIKHCIEKGVVPSLIMPFDISKDKLIEAILDRSQSEREKEIMIRRYGVVTGERETLEEIGKYFGITRERVRQIQNKTISRMRHPSTKSRKPLTEIIESIFLDNGGVISSNEADKLLPPALENQNIDGSSVLDLISDIGWIQKHWVGGEPFYGSAHTNFKLDSVMEEIVNILKKERKLLSRDEIIIGLRGFLGDDTDPDIISSFISKCCNSDPRIEKIDNKYTLYSIPGNVTKKWVYYISQVLERSGVPLHFTEIAERVNDQFKDDNISLEQRRVHAILVQDPMFAHTGSWGMYGLTKWGLRKESTLDLAEEYIKKAGFPVHWEQIYDYVSKYKYTKPANIASILSNNTRFVNKGNGMYWLKNS